MKRHNAHCTCSHDTHKGRGDRLSGRGFGDQRARRRIRQKLTKNPTATEREKNVWPFKRTGPFDVTFKESISTRTHTYTAHTFVSSNTKMLSLPKQCNPINQQSKIHLRNAKTSLNFLLRIDTNETCVCVCVLSFWKQRGRGGEGRGA
jgi:hypothetical protein